MLSSTDQSLWGQVVEGLNEESGVEDIARLLSFFEVETAAARNFELTQALLRVALQVRMLFLASRGTTMS